MTTNRLAKSTAPVVPALPADPDERRRFIIDSGNQRLWGLAPNSRGEFAVPRPHLHWVCSKDGRDYRIEPRDASQ